MKASLQLVRLEIKVPPSGVLPLCRCLQGLGPHPLGDHGRPVQKSGNAQHAPIRRALAGPHEDAAASAGCWELEACPGRIPGAVRHATR